MRRIANNWRVLAVLVALTVFAGSLGGCGGDGPAVVKSQKKKKAKPKRPPAQSEKPIVKPRTTPVLDDSANKRQLKSFKALIEKSRRRRGRRRTGR